MPTQPKSPRRQRGMEMPPDIRHLYMIGHLYPDEARRLCPGHPVMTCILCQAEVALLCTFDSFTAEQMAEKNRVLPGLIWGTNVLVMCPCCSMDHCTHTTRVPPSPHPTEPRIDWIAAGQHLHESLDAYKALGPAGVFALTLTIYPCKARFDAGERTQELYDAIMAIA